MNVGATTAGRAWRNTQSATFNVAIATWIAALVALGSAVACSDSGPACGDGFAESPELCDDGNTLSGDGCDATCAVEPGYSCTGTPSVCMSTCGDGTVDPTEDCDDMGESVTCDADCTAVACGDGTFNATAGEECDDAGETANCDIDCTLPMCGDGTLNVSAGEVCDGPGETATCDPDCTSPLCGDATVNMSAGEQCDDGNVVPGDGCDAMCALECDPSLSLITLYANNNGLDGNMFDVTAINTVTIVSFDQNLAVGTHDVEIYYRAGSYVGFENNAAGWTMLVAATGVVSNGVDVATPLPIAVDVVIPAGQVYSFYITVTSGGNVEYTDGTSEGAVFVSDANIQIHEGLGKAYPFGGTFTPRVWNGTVFYSDCP